MIPFSNYVFLYNILLVAILELHGLKKSEENVEKQGQLIDFWSAGSL